MAAVAVERREGVSRLRIVRSCVSFSCTTVTAAALAVACFVGYATPRVWSIHTADADVRPTLETAIAAAAIIAVILLVARFRQTRLLRDLLLLVAVATVALTDLVFHGLPAYGHRVGAYSEGAGLTLATVGAVAFVVVAFVSADRKVLVSRRTALIASSACIGWLALGEALDLVTGSVGNRARAGVVAAIHTPIAFLFVVLLVVAGLGLANRRAPRLTENRLLSCVVILLAGAALARLQMRGVPGNWIEPSDALRVAASAVLIAVSVLRYRRSVDEQAHAALSAERQRIARDLHDGLAQDLAFIAAHGDRLARELGDEHPLTIAARRALATSRGQIIDLEASGAPDTAAALREIAAELSARFGVRVVVREQDANQPEPTPAERSELVRIAREAIANAVRHGGARHITVTLGSRRDQLLLRITDDGRGLPATAGERQHGSAEDAQLPTAGTGLGIRTMRARADRIGAQLRTRDREAHPGTEVEVLSSPRG